MTVASILTTTPLTSAPPRSVAAPSLLACIGRTPMISLARLAANSGLVADVVLLAKVESFNAGGSIKARPALAMVAEGERRGLLTPAKTIIEATSGNTGIALAMIGTARGYPVKLVMPEDAGPERKKILAAYGAGPILTPAKAGMEGAIRVVEALVDRQPEGYFRPDQYNNPVNWQAHYRTTGPEIWRQTGGAVTHLVAGIGTGGTLMGTGRRLKALAPTVRVVAVEPATGRARIEGLKHMASSQMPRVYDPAFSDDCLPVTPKQARLMVRRLAQEEGLFVGHSAGAAAWAALELARSLTQVAVIVVIFPDGGEKYLDTPLN